MSTITIHGKTYNVSEPYAEGHSLTETEAKALNRARAERLYGLLGAKAKDNTSLGQSDVDAADATFSFDTLARRGGGGMRDPIKAIAMEMAERKVKAAIKAKGHNVSDYKMADVTKLAREYLTANEDSLMGAARAVYQTEQGEPEADIGGVGYAPTADAGALTPPVQADASQAT